MILENTMPHIETLAIDVNQTTHKRWKNYGSQFSKLREVSYTFYRRDSSDREGDEDDNEDDLDAMAEDQYVCWFDLSDVQIVLDSFLQVLL